jgi:hypothetical protein
LSSRELLVIEEREIKEKLLTVLKLTSAYSKALRLLSNENIQGALDILQRMRSRPDLTPFRRSLVTLLIATIVDPALHDRKQFAQEALDSLRAVRNDAIQEIPEDVILEMERRARGFITEPQTPNPDISDDEEEVAMGNDLNNEEGGQGSNISADSSGMWISFTNPCSRAYPGNLLSPFCVSFVPHYLNIVLIIICRATTPR